MRSKGFEIENTAKVFLEQQQLKLLTQNFHSRFGEIDLIMLDKDTVCFIEVRHRKSSTYGSAAESITYTKQQKIHKTALFYLQKNIKYAQNNLRFDVLLSQGEGNQNRIEWIKNAF